VRPGIPSADWANRRGATHAHAVRRPRPGLGHRPGPVPSRWGGGELGHTYISQRITNLIVEDPYAWAKRVRDLRNDLAHHRERFRLDGSVGGHLISEQLFWLFVLCILRVAEAPDEVFECIAKHPDWDWLRKKAGEAQP